MAYGTELFIGFRGKERIDIIATTLGLSVDFDNGDITPETSYAQIQLSLKQAWLDAIKEIGLEFIDYNADDPRRRYPNIRTSTGDRKMVIWRLEFQYDYHEMGDEPQDAVLGVSLISRYFPTYLDWREEHGGSGLVISLDTETLTNIQIARKHIEKVLPIFATADIHMKELHY